MTPNAFPNPCSPFVTVRVRSAIAPNASISAAMAASIARIVLVVSGFCSAKSAISLTVSRTALSNTSRSSATARNTRMFSS